MANYISATTTTVTGTAANIVTAGKLGETYELQSNGSGFWFSDKATATVGGANCHFVPPGGFVEVRIASATANISAIKNTGDADAGVTASLVQP